MIKGLSNFGANCYINAALQSIIHIPLFSDHINIDIDIKKIANMTNFDIYTQSDSFEFLIIFLEKLHQKLKYIPKIMINNEIYNKNKDYINLIDLNENNIPYTKNNVICFAIKTTNELYKREYSYIKKIFTNQIISTSNDKSFAFEMTEVIEIDINNYNEFHWPDNKYIWKISPIVIIRLKRFNDKQKIEKKINMPLSLNFNNYKSKFLNITFPIYTLTSVIEHIGSLNSGHYISYTKKNNIWYLCNDLNVYKCKPNLDTGYVYIYIQ